MVEKSISFKINNIRPLKVMKITEKDCSLMFQTANNKFWSIRFAKPREKIFKNFIKLKYKNYPNHLLTSSSNILLDHICKIVQGSNYLTLTWFSIKFNLAKRRENNRNLLYSLTSIAQHSVTQSTCPVSCHIQ